MSNPTDARSKAEASLRLAERAKTPRARELFKQLAEEYEQRAKAEAGEDAEAAPPLVPADPVAPLAESEQWLANLAAVREEASSGEKS
jgi:hypothetical protein